MKLAISNIAWDSSEEDAVLDCMAQIGFSGLEVAPSKIFSRPLEASDSQAAAYRRQIELRGFKIVAAQSLLYGQAELSIFKTEALRHETLAYLDQISALCAKLGAWSLVFGSPKNRQRGPLPMSEALPLAVDFFRAAGESAARHGTVLCIEANPPDYGCDFITTTREALEFVRQVDHPGFRLHVDASSMTLNHEDTEKVLADCAGWAAHFHASEPFLAPIGAGGTDHRAIARQLRAAGYDGWVSIEMKQPGPPPNLETIRGALVYIRDIYG